MEIRNLVLKKISGQSYGFIIPKQMITHSQLKPGSKYWIFIKKEDVEVKNDVL